jgi:hypothetical protein
LLMKRSLFTGRPPLAPRPRLGTCAQAGGAPASSQSERRGAGAGCAEGVCVQHTQAARHHLRRAAPGRTRARTHLCPHLLDVFQDHVAVPVKCLDAAQQLVVVAAVDEHLGIGGVCWWWWGGGGRGRRNCDDGCTPLGRA